MSPHAEVPMDVPEEHAPAIQQAFTGFASNGQDETDFPAFENRSHLRYTDQNDLHDLICVGFGPASLAIAVALHDAMDRSDPSLDLPNLQRQPPKVAFLEKQSQFAWHAGMLLPGAKMQITFLKDMATMRNPRSEFTFVNYLHQKDRLIDFTNLNTFLPQRIEYENYMRWCASWFDEVVQYDQEVVQIIPEKSASGNGEINTFNVMSRNLQTGQVETRRTKHVVIAAGGRPNLPAPFPSNHPRVIHSSKFSHISPKILPDFQKPYSIAVVGNGQSAAEIFDYLHTHYPNAKTRLLIKQAALRPSDDSPFVNEVFNPGRVASTYNRSPALRATAIADDKATNYGVVRLPLLEHIYETLYLQRITHGNTPAAEQRWPHAILPYRRVTRIAPSPSIFDGLRLSLEDRSPLYLSEEPGQQEREEILDVDAVFVATGYRRDAHETLLGEARHLMPGGDLEGARWSVGRNYRVNFEKRKVGREAGVWLQGCCESTHGLSDTLLSILANRGGDLVNAIFGGKANEQEARWKEELRAQL